MANSRRISSAVRCQSGASERLASGLMPCKLRLLFSACLPLYWLIDNPLDHDGQRVFSFLAPHHAVTISKARVRHAFTSFYHFAGWVFRLRLSQDFAVVTIF